MGARKKSETNDLVGASGVSDSRRGLGKRIHAQLRPKSAPKRGKKNKNRHLFVLLWLRAYLRIRDVFISCFSSNSFSITFVTFITKGFSILFFPENSQAQLLIIVFKYLLFSLFCLYFKLRLK